MTTLQRAVTLVGILLAAGCTDRAGLPTAPPPVAGNTQIGATDPALDRVAAIGTIETVDPDARRLVLRQSRVAFTPAAGAVVKEARVDFAIGSADNALPVLATAGTRIFLKGEERTFADLQPGTQLMAVGRARDGSLEAEIIADLTSDDAAAERARALRQQRPPELREAPPPSPDAGVLAFRCTGFTFDYSDPHILDFQGCWGGPSSSGEWDVNVPLFCPLIGCLMLDKLTYTVALGGGQFAFPFEFRANAPSELIYHVPGTVALQVIPKPASAGAFTFTGGTGGDVGIDFDVCPLYVCTHLYTAHINEFSSIYQSKGAGPLEGVLDIGEVACPGIGVLNIPGVPDPLGVEACQDNRLLGRPFHTIVSALGNDQAAVSHEITSAGSTQPVRPVAMEVEMRFKDLEWIPRIDNDLNFRLTSFGYDLWTSPSIHLLERDFPAVTNPYPIPGTNLFLARDPNSDDALRQPESTSVFLAVAKAPTALGFTSGSVLAEGTPVTLRLVEELTGATIPGVPLTLLANGLGGIPSVTRDATTDAKGIATFELPVGEYSLTATYEGGSTYLPSSAALATVYVFRPTTFVIWGGNPGGVAIGERYQFWGHGWVNQVVSGRFSGNASFQGFAIPLSATAWASPPAASGHGPASLPHLIGVIVTTEVTGRGANAVGNIAGHALIRVDDPSAYRPDGGHPASGLVRALLP